MLARGRVCSGRYAISDASGVLHRRSPATEVGHPSDFGGNAAWLPHAEPDSVDGTRGRPSRGWPGERLVGVLSVKELCEGALRRGAPRQSKRLPACLPGRPRAGLASVPAAKGPIPAHLRSPVRLGFVPEKYITTRIYTLSIAPTATGGWASPCPLTRCQLMRAASPEGKSSCDKSGRWAGAISWRTPPPKRSSTPRTFARGTSTSSRPVPYDRVHAHAQKCKAELGQ